MASKRSFLHFLLLILHLSSYNSFDIITTNQTFQDGHLLVSGNGKFAFGFFTPGNSVHRYVGIWYHKISQLSVVWIANRNNPINGSSGFLSFDRYGNLALYNDPRQKIPLWFANVSGELDDSCAAQLLDSGNLVLLQGRSRTIVWQSFDYLIDTLIPGAKARKNFKTGQEWSLTSWRSEDDPGTGKFSLKINPSGTPQLILYEGSKRRHRLHLWPRRRFSGIYNYVYNQNQEEANVVFDMNDNSTILIARVDYTGIYKWLRWSESIGQWKEFMSVPKHTCDLYGRCGAYGKCTPTNPDTFECSCLPGYEPRLPRDWQLRDGSGGCIRKRMESASVCKSGDGFLKIKNLKFPDTSFVASLHMNTSHQQCETECLTNCSCSAYASINNLLENECLTWHGELIDTVEHMVGNGRFDMYVRVDALELAESTIQSTGFLRDGVKMLIVPVTSVWLTIIVFAYLWVKRRKRRERKNKQNRLLNPASGSIYYKNTLVASELEQPSHPQDVSFFDLSIIAAATNNFSAAKKLGQGGFGVVYKGQLSNGKEIAVKRLSTNSGQGIEELKNEVVLIAKLQHRNLVKLLGCCIEEGEQMLIYEYLPNKSLDSVLFDQTRQQFLDWKKRFDIIIGIARGILYLHQDSRLTIIHMDLKCSNILLDAKMNPKISDFGMARIFRTDQIQEKTNRVVGTYGYMSPEYAIFGKFSTKSDVFSFGVILLEIVSAKKNNGFHEEDPSLSLIEHVWQLWRQNRGTEIIDSSMEGSYSRDEALRCIQIGLLCVQENAEDRPTMVEVVPMLGSEKALPSPKQPAFIYRKSTNNCNSITPDENASSSINEVTITSLASR